MKCITESTFALLASLLIFSHSSLGEERIVYSTSVSRELPIIGVSTLGIVFPYLFSDQLIHKRCPCDPNEVNGLDRGVIGNSNKYLDSLSDVTTIAAVGIPLALDWSDLGTSPALAQDILVFAEVLSVNGALATLAKYTAQRPLPRTYAGDTDLINSPGGYRSFYSGHTSTTFAALSATSVTLDLRYDAGAWPWLGTALIGTAVAAERVAAGRHFYTDVAMGALMGTALGTAIPLLHRKGTERSHFTIAPRNDGVMLLWARRF